MNLKIHSIMWLLLLFHFSALAQNGDNPFELTPRLTPTQQADTASNPFDIRVRATTAPLPAAPPTAVLANPVPKPGATSSEYYGGFLFGVILFSLLLLTLMFLAFRPVIEKIFRSLTNDNMLSQVYRERKTGGGGPYFMVYLMFIINAGIFLFLILARNDTFLADGYFYSLLLCIGLVLAAFLAKHMLLGLVGYIFPVYKEISLYSFTILVFSVVIGLLLVPANLIIAYAPDFMATATLWTTLALITILYLFRAGRGLFIANRFLTFHKFHFLLYICTVEIAPALIVIKLITSELSL